MNTKKISSCIIAPVIIVLSLALWSCDGLFTNNGAYNTEKKADSIKIGSIIPDSAYKHYTVNIYIPSDSDIVFLEERPWLKLRAKTIFNGKVADSLDAFHIDDVKNIATEYIKRNDVAMQLVVDLTLSDSLIAMQKTVAMRLADLFNDNNMYISFFDANGLSETLPLTKYVLDKYFQQSPAVYPKKIYRTLLAELQRMGDEPEFTYLPQTPKNTQWQNLKEGKRFLMLCSDGQTYSKHNFPLDSRHFDLKEDLLSAGTTYPDIQIFAINMGDSATADNFMQQVCANSGGHFMPSCFTQYAVSKTLYLLHPDSSNYSLSLSLPDNTVLRGGSNKLSVELSQGDSLVAKGTKKFTFGSLYNPIVVNGHSVIQAIAWGLIIFFILIVTCYIIMQYVLPWIMYKRFRKKYVVSYTGPDMAVDGHTVGTTCHYCKAPFEIGDTIVSKCEHSMHEDCWEENGCKCTEYGRRCHKGAHYYNAANKSDSRNALFYMKWVMAGIISGTLAWIMFMIGDSNRDFILRLLLEKVSEGVSAEELEWITDNYDLEIYFLPYFGLYINLFLGFFINLLAGHGCWNFRRIGMLVTKTIASSLVGYCAFMIDGALTIIFLTNYDALFAWFPWTLSSFGLVAIASYGTDIKVSKVKNGILASIIIGVAAEYIAQYVVNSHTDIRLFLLLAHIMYAAGACVSIAYHTPRSERFFLRMEGSIKRTDIALYKWFTDRTRLTHVTIGHSVNCNLQITWDVKADIAPEAVKISLSNDNIYLTILDKGVTMNGRELSVGKHIRLYHGSSFIIGTTVFTYLERDV